MKIVLFLFNAYFVSASFLDEIKICKRTDPLLNDCLKTSIQESLSLLRNGYPKIGFPALEPIKVAEVRVGASAPFHFDFMFQNVELHNRSYAKIEKVEANIGHDKFFISVLGSNLNTGFAAKYKYTNAVFSQMDLGNSGNFSENHDENNIVVNITGDVISKNNGRFLQISDFHFQSDNSNIGVQLESKDKEFDKILNQIIKENTHILHNSLVSSFHDMFEKVFHDLAQILFFAVDYDQLFPK